MRYEEIKNDFIKQIMETLDAFAKTEENKEVYAIVFDCDYETGQIVLRYSNNRVFQELTKHFEEYRDLYEPYGKNGLFGMKYNSVGDFPELKAQYEEITNDFLDSYYYYSVGDYYGDSELIDKIEIGNEVMEGEELEIQGEKSDGIAYIYTRLVMDTIDYVKENIAKIDITNDFLIFMCDHDISNEEFEEYVRKTNDRGLVDTLCRIMD